MINIIYVHISVCVDHRFSLLYGQNFQAHLRHVKTINKKSGVYFI